MYTKELLTVLFACISFTLVAQTGNYTVNMKGIADFKIGMKKTEVEKLLGQPLKLKNLLIKDEWTRDTILHKYKELDISLVFDKQFVEDNKTEIVLWQAFSSSPLIKTPSGITIGDDKIKIITTYDGYTIHIAPDYEDNFTVKSKTKSTVYLYGDEGGNQICFYLDKNKVYAIGVSYMEEYD